MFLSMIFNMFSFNKTRRREKYFCRYGLETFRTEDALEFHVKDFLTLAVNKELIRLPGANVLDPKVLRDQ